MKIKLLTLFFMLIFFGGKAQNFLLTAVLSAKGNLKYYELKANQINFKIDDEGNLISFSPDVFEGTYEYYDDFAPANISGKIRKTGNTSVEYYDNFNQDFSGKPSKIGNIYLEYYQNQFSFKDGKLRKIGEIPFLYYDNEFTDAAKYGKLKSFADIKIQYGGEMFTAASSNQLTFIGNTQIQYWDEIFGGAQRGKIKSINGKTPKLKIIVE